MVSSISRKDIGDLGESIATRYMVENGFSIVQRNYIDEHIGEIDIIAYRDGVLHFVEVKTSGTYEIGSELHSGTHFDKKKKDRTVKVMQRYCFTRNITLPRTVSLILLRISRETKTAQVFFDPYVHIDTV